MRIMYIASKGLFETDLELTREITELQRLFATAQGEKIDFRILPDTRLDKLFEELAAFKPHILHITSHANPDGLFLMGPSDDSVRVNANDLSTFMSPQAPPLLIYLNSCDSTLIANELVTRGAASFAIGSTAPVTTLAGRNGASALYRRILAGHTLAESFAHCAAIVKMSSDTKVSVELFPIQSRVEPSPTLYRIPRVIADFAGLKAKKPTSQDSRTFSLDADGDLDVLLGVIGCPDSARQVVFFNDDPDHVYDLWSIIHRPPRSGVLWTGGDEDEEWSVSADIHIFATIVMSDKSSITVESTLSDAIQRKYEAGGRSMPSLASDAVEWLKKKTVPIELSAGGPHPGSKPRPQPAKRRTKPRKKPSKP